MSVCFVCCVYVLVVKDNILHCIVMSVSTGTHLLLNLRTIRARANGFPHFLTDRVTHGRRKLTTLFLLAGAVTEISLVDAMR